MVKNNVLKGVVLVGLGASSYGMLATFVKLAYEEGYTTAEVTASQILLGIAGMLLINIFQKAKKGDTVVKASPKNRLQLIVAGTSMGFTSVFYYVAVKYIPVSIGIVLLMQTVWMGVLLEWLLTKVTPSPRKILSVVIVLAGTLLATNLVKSDTVPDWRGLVWGLMAAASFTATMFTSNTIATHISSAQRSLFMLMGGAVIVLGFTAFTWPGTFNFEIFLTWGLVLALFGTIIPPILLNAGFPRTGLGLGSIVSSLELPVSVTMAYVILHEQVNLLQWLGIALILGAIVLMNIKMPGQK
ncbi:DMT family transporter [Flavobacterium sp. DGU11]|uniref:DMT family transporter n=1 Tax=Flavobacterium arundinis TaxID=3139143 RepID=A0ABU9HZI9_9FLAO